MKDELFAAEKWLRRTWDVGAEIAELETRKEKILSSMSGVAKYDAKAIRGGSDSNPTESILLKRAARPWQRLSLKR